MKTLNDILKQDPVFLHNWKTKIDVISDFDNIYMSEIEYSALTAPYANAKLWEEKKAQMKAELQQWKDLNILFASYGENNCTGDAFVLFEKSGELFEVNAGHCSCYGLEGQFAPEATTIDALAHRLIQGTMGVDSHSDNEFAAELKTFIGL